MQQNNQPIGRPSWESIAQHLAEAVEALASKFGGLPNPGAAEMVRGEIWVHDAHNSTAIEGNTLVLREVEALLVTGRAVVNFPNGAYTYAGVVTLTVKFAGTDLTGYIQMPSNPVHATTTTTSTTTSTTATSITTTTI